MPKATKKVEQKDENMVELLQTMTLVQASVRRFLVRCRPKRESVLRVVEQRRSARRQALRSEHFAPGQDINLDLVRDLPAMTPEAAHSAIANMGSLKKAALTSNLVKSVQWLVLAIESTATLADQNTFASLQTELQNRCSGRSALAFDASSGSATETATAPPAEN